jgi:uncharacterized protein YebE (UPF0316 family)
MDALFALPYGSLFIFALRVVDVSMGTFRIMVTVRGHRGMSAAIGFVEVLIWIVAVGQALQHLDSIYHVVGYAAGFAAGNYVGILVENGLALGTVVVRAIIPDETDRDTARTLREEGYVVTELEGRGRDGPVDVLNTVVPRKDAADVVAHIEAAVPDSFITVEELRTTHRGTLRPSDRRPHGQQLVRRSGRRPDPQSRAGGLHGPKHLDNAGQGAKLLAPLLLRDLLTGDFRVRGREGDRVPLQVDAAHDDPGGGVEKVDGPVVQGFAVPEHPTNAFARFDEVRHGVA